jgi:CBS domain-containing protein
MGKTVRDVMTESPRSVEPGETVVKAARVMRDEDVGSLPVLEDGRLVGMITDRDLAIRVIAEAMSPERISVGDVVSPEPVSAAPDDDLDEALRLMARHQVRRLPVVEGERLVGILAQADVALAEKEKKTGEVVEAISEPSEADRR